MTTPGTNLEHLVKRIEESLVPEGFSVEANQRVVENGVIIAEFDIVITGNSGSIPTKTLIECRDRPSQGPQGREWIQQLIGRRSDFKFDGIAAVSTTGFTEGAKELAKREKITLRTVKEATQIVDVLSSVSFTIGNPEVKLLGALQIVPIEDSNACLPLNNKVFKNEEMRFRELTEIEGLDFYNFLLRNLPERLKEDGAHFFEFRVLKPIEIRSGNQRMMAKEISAPIMIRKGHIVGKAIALRDYDSETGLVAQTVSVLFDTAIGPIKTEWSFAFANNGMSINVLNVDWPGGKPVNVTSLKAEVSEGPAKAS